MSVLEEIHQAVNGLSESIAGSVVGIGGRFGVGSGIVIGGGRVVTNAHNVRGEQVAVTFAGGRKEAGTVAGIDPDVDLAVIDVETADATPLQLAEGAPLSVGLPVFGASNPRGRGLRVTFGLISGVERSFPGPRGRTIRGAVEHTAPLLPGSSGGPLLDISGRVLGINTNRLGEGFYLAIPADDALRTSLDALGRGESPNRPRLGVGIAPPDVARGLRRAVGLPEADGLLVRHVADDSPAFRAGIKEGDLIVEVGNRKVASVEELYEALDSAAGKFEVKVVRGIEERAVTIDLEGAAP